MSVFDIEEWPRSEDEGEISAARARAVFDTLGEGLIVWGPDGSVIDCNASAAAILGIIGFLDIPLIHMSVYWWRTLHQPPSILRPDKAPWENVHPAMLTALAISFVGFLLLYFYLLSLRYRLGEMRQEIKALKMAGGA